MKLTRRLLLASASSALLGRPGASAQDQNLTRTNYRRPDPKRVATGDLLWPKQPGAPIRLSTEGSQDTANDEAIWEEQRRELSVRAQSTPADSPQRRALAAINGMTYAEFQERFTTGLTDQELRQHSSLTTTGHVCIVDASTSADILIIEAMPRPGVQRLRYEDWLSNRTEQIIWHGRVAELGADQREAVAKRAASWLHRPYVWANLDLADESNFYCSKLVWLAYYLGAQLSLDGDQRTSRTWFLSPKTLLASRHIAILNDPSEYDKR